MNSKLELFLENSEGKEIRLEVDLRVYKEINDYRYGRNWSWCFEVNRINAFDGDQPYNYTSDEAKEWNAELEQAITERADSIISEVA
jgi:hypothetical protein